jgi:endonuclease/exonuclease/phosphatase family metal-dependent hydrolase
MATMPLRVATWNLWWRFGPFEQRQRAIELVLREVDADVICLQEVWATDGDGSADQADILGDALSMHVTRTAPMFYDGHSFGNAVLSRWPAERLADEPLPRADGEPGHRRVVAAAIDSPWGRWPVAATHLDHRFDASHTRQRQVEALLSMVSEWRGDPTTDLPVILGADLNAVPDSEEVRLLTGLAPGVEGIVMSDVWGQCGDGPGATWRRGNPYLDDTAWPDRRLDYLLVSWPRPKPVGNPLRCRLAGDGPVDVDGRGDTEGVWPSDHAAVVADFVTPAAG